METLIDCGYTLSQWRAEHPRDRARLVCHYMEKNLRQDLARHLAEKEAEAKSKSEAKHNRGGRFPGARG